VFAISVFAQVDELSAISDNVLQFRLKRPFRLMADLLGKPNPFAPVVMPERLAMTEPGQQVREVIGSGPYRFVMKERIPGSLAVLSTQRRLRPAYRRATNRHRRLEDRQLRNNTGIRQALLGAFSQVDVMGAWPVTTARCGRRASEHSRRVRRLQTIPEWRC
jgi:hypothetical protein